MKRLLITLAFILLSATIWAQSDSLITTGIAQDDTTSVGEVAYRAPNRNPIYYFGSPFASHFAELNFIVGDSDLGIGLTYTYLPEVWGGHLFGYAGFTARWLMVGADYRLSKPWSKADWQLFGSLGYRHGSTDGELLSASSPSNIGYRPAMEVGIRVGGIPSRGSFCMNSASLGVLTDFQHYYLTLGFSASFAILSSTFFLLGL